MTLRDFYVAKRRRMLDQYFPYLDIEPTKGWLDRHGDRVLLPREIECLGRLAKLDRRLAGK
jgi:hypothetical protein